MASATPRSPATYVICPTRVAARSADRLRVIVERQEPPRRSDGECRIRGADGVDERPQRGIHELPALAVEATDATSVGEHPHGVLARAAGREGLLEHERLGVLGTRA